MAYDHFKVPNWILDNGVFWELTKVEADVLMAHCRWMRDDKDNNKRNISWYGSKTLSKMIKHDLKLVKRARQRLIELGILKVVGQKKLGRGSPAKLYQVVPDLPQTMEDKGGQINTPLIGLRGVNSSQQGGSAPKEKPPQVSI
jgi:hypothetical protein